MKPELRVALLGQGFMGKAHSNAYAQVGHFYDLPYRVRRTLLCGRDATSLSEGEDNEPTGVEVGSGKATPAGMKGTLASLTKARSFFTQQHGQNTLWEIVRTFARQPG